jgi:hypothetical protein
MRGLAGFAALLLCAASPLERNLAVGRVVLEETPLVQVSASYGAARVATNGLAAAKSLRYICYLGTDGTALLFMSNEMGGLLVNEFELANDGASVDITISGAAPRGPLRCSPSNGVSKALATRGGLRLGMKRGEVEGLLGRPWARGSDRWTYAASESTGAASERHEQLELLFGGDVLRRIRGSQSTVDR